MLRGGLFAFGNQSRHTGFGSPAGRPEERIDYDKSDKGTAKPTPNKGAAHKGNDVEGNRNADVDASRVAGIGLDTQGQFRLGDKYTLHVEGSDVAIRQSHSGLKATVSPSELEGLLEEHFFTNK